MQFHTVQEYLKKTVRVVFLFFFVLSFFYYAVVSVGHIGGTSMAPTLQDGERFFVNKIIYLVSTPKRFDIVQMIDRQDDILIVKRIIGLPGETVIIRENGVFLRTPQGEEKRLEESYLPPFTETSVSGQMEFVVPPDHYFVLGDNRGASKDSRVFGTIHRKYINGRIFFL